MIKSPYRFFSGLFFAWLVCWSAWSAELAVRYREGALARLGITAADPFQKVATFSFFAPPDVSKRDAFTDPRTMAVVGGVMFTATATPASNDIAKCPDLKIDAKGSDGTRLRAKFGAKQGRAYIFDWEMLPLVQFINDGEAALYTDVGRSKYHRAFQDNLVGVNLFLLDNVAEMEEFPRAHILFENRIPGYPQLEPSADTQAAWSQVKPILSFSRGFSQMMFVDRDVDFKFGLDGSDLKISGVPYWLLLRKKADGSGQIFDEVKNTELVRRTNPTIYDSIYRISKFAAFFRYIKESCPANWESFLNEVESNKAELVNIPIAQMPKSIRRTRLQ
ncbi:hypothetical protein [Bradyrhizobium sp. Ai1a-2]|uniref:hypothetical protein n=1 Tax=Bradyrhizobium sp. Ai1a-2 TaxID=196490 RepID=UPI00126928AF|nr:hypothetical protein [Bradyrhizobium sp. Ai1a-2]